MFVELHISDLGSKAHCDLHLSSPFVLSGHDLINIPSKIVHPTLWGCLPSCFGLCPIQVFFNLTKAVLPVIFETPRLRAAGLLELPRFGNNDRGGLHRLLPYRFGFFDQVPNLFFEGRFLFATQNQMLPRLLSVVSSFPSAHLVFVLVFFLGEQGC